MDPRQSENKSPETTVALCEGERPYHGHIKQKQIRVQQNTDDVQFETASWHWETRALNKGGWGKR